tara:strand:- start:1782 stop:2027 length:246 start_codon:yes stop_codon:yes gene_type:complete
MAWMTTAVILTAGLLWHAQPGQAFADPPNAVSARRLVPASPRQATGLHRRGAAHIENRLPDQHYPARFLLRFSPSAGPSCR